MQRVLLAHAFWDVDARILQAGDGREALAVVEEGCPDLVIMDSRMPGLGGPETVAALRVRGCRSRLVLMSGNTAEFAHVANGRDDVAAVIEKPIDLANLRAIVHKVIGG